MDLDELLYNLNSLITEDPTSGLYQYYLLNGFDPTSITGGLNAISGILILLNTTKLSKTISLSELDTPFSPGLFQSNIMLLDIHSPSIKINIYISTGGAQYPYLLTYSIDLSSMEQTETWYTICEDLLNKLQEIAPAIITIDPSASVTIEIEGGGYRLDNLLLAENIIIDDFESYPAGDTGDELNWEIEQGVSEIFEVEVIDTQGINKQALDVKGSPLLSTQLNYDTIDESLPQLSFVLNSQEITGFVDVSIADAVNTESYYHIIYFFDNTAPSSCSYSVIGNFLTLRLDPATALLESETYPGWYEFKDNCKK